MKIGFIGAGKVGTSMGNYFTQKGLSVSGYYSRSKESAIRSASLTGSDFFEDIDSLLKSGEIIFITTGDDAINGISLSLRQSPSLRKDHTFVHTSGALSSDILESLEKFGCGVSSLHPIMTFSDIETATENLQDTIFTLEGNHQGKARVEAILSETDNEFFTIDKENKTLYHAAACVLSNYLVTLIDSGFEMLRKAGLDDEGLSHAFLPLINATLNNVNNIGTVNALTGPLVRGDENTISRHVKAIESIMPEYLNLYQTMGVSTLDMIRDKRIDSNKYQILKNILLKGE